MRPAAPSVGQFFSLMIFSAATQMSLRATLAYILTISRRIKAAPCATLPTLYKRKIPRWPSGPPLLHQRQSRLCKWSTTSCRLMTPPEVGRKHFAISSHEFLGVCAGQGAQWPRIGAMFAEASPFAFGRLVELDVALSSLPEKVWPVWTLQKQLAVYRESSRILEAAVSQPICTAVQILLIDMVNAAVVRLDAVIRHSSGSSLHSALLYYEINLHYVGEIAATYVAGLLAASNAIRIAYFRGFYAKLAKSPEAALVPCGCWHLYRGCPRLLQSTRIQRPNPNRCSQLRVKHYSLR